MCIDHIPRGTFREVYDLWYVSDHPLLLCVLMIHIMLYVGHVHVHPHSVTCIASCLMNTMHNSMETGSWPSLSRSSAVAKTGSGR